MTCNSDFDDEKEALLRQADECVEPWWDPNAKKMDTKPETQETTDPAEIAEAEALKRGLLKREDDGTTCMACSDNSEKK